jgi:hypothetical protein
LSNLVLTAELADGLDQDLSVSQCRPNVVGAGRSEIVVTLLSQLQRVVECPSESGI